MSGAPRLERRDGPNLRPKGPLVALIALGLAATMVLGHAAKTAFAPSVANNEAPASNTLSPYDIHFNYLRFSDLPVQG
jgi:hypothetical protein